MDKYLKAIGVSFLIWTFITILRHFTDDKITLCVYHFLVCFGVGYYFGGEK